MLIALLPEQVSAYWGAIKLTIEQSAPPTARKNLDMNKVLECVLSGRLQVWTLVNEEGKVLLILTTTVAEDFCSDGKSLMIFSIFGLGTVGPRNWKEGFETLKRHAASLGCDKIVAYTTEDVVRKLVRYFGGDDSYTYLRLEV
jgi:hypothetical protein